MNSWFQYWTFRTSTPSFEEGEEFVVEVNDFDSARGEPVARIGDSRLFLPDLDQEAKGALIQLRVTSFDSDNNTGTAERIETIRQFTT